VRGSIEELFPHAAVVPGQDRMAKIARGAYAYQWCLDQGLVHYGIYTHLDGSKHYNRDATFYQLNHVYRFLDRDTAMLFRLSI
jgi:hypothetical protein